MGQSNPSLKITDKTLSKISLNHENGNLFIAISLFQSLTFCCSDEKELTWQPIENELADDCNSNRLAFTSLHCLNATLNLSIKKYWIMIIYMLRLRLDNLIHKLFIIIAYIEFSNILMFMYINLAKSTE